MRSHGGGMACYYGHRPKTGSCEPCRTSHAKRQTNHNRSERHRDADVRYDATAKGFLRRVRDAARKRLG